MEHPSSINTATSDAAADVTMIPTPKVRKRYGDVSESWLDRKLAEDPTFPKPKYIGRRRFWIVAELIAWERGLLLAATKTKAPPPPLRRAPTTKTKAPPPPRRKARRRAQLETPNTAGGA